MFYIYIIQNKLTNKIYVGKSSDPEDRWKRHIVYSKGGKEKYPLHFQYLHASIAKYGMDQFTFQIIEEFENEIDCFEAEQFWIEFFRSWDREYGYNLTRGGEGASGRIVSQETREKISIGNAGKTISDEHKKILLQYAGSHNQSEETKKKRIASLKNKKRTIEQNIANSERQNGKILPQSQINNMKKSAKRGDKSPRAKLTNEQAFNIRKLYTDKLYTMKQLAVKYGVGETTISYIINFKTFKEAV